MHKMFFLFFLLFWVEKASTPCDFSQEKILLTFYNFVVLQGLHNCSRTDIYDINSYLLYDLVKRHPLSFIIIFMKQLKFIDSKFKSSFQLLSIPCYSHPEACILSPYFFYIWHVNEIIHNASVSVGKNADNRIAHFFSPEKYLMWNLAFAIKWGTFLVLISSLRFDLQKTLFLVFR